MPSKSRSQTSDNGAEHLKLIAHLPLVEDQVHGTKHLHLVDYLMLELESRARELVLQINVVDDWLRDIDSLLNALQPWKSGRLGISPGLRMESERFHAAVMQFAPRRVHPKSFHYMKLGREWRYKRLKPTGLSDRGKTARAWHDNRRVIKELLKLGSDLLKVRESLLKPFTSFKLSYASNFRHAGPKTAEVGAKVLKIQAAKAAGEYRTSWDDFNSDPDKD